MNSTLLAKRIPLALSGIVLLAAIALQAFDPTSEVSRAKPPHLAEALPMDLVGWTTQDVPLGPTEFINEKVAETLKFDDVLNRRYNRGDLEIGVYIAYWGPGKMPTRLVASHTPDRCWTSNGWTCLDMRFDEQLALGEAALQSADWRSFKSPGGEIVDVLFWHLIDGRAYDYGERFNKVPHIVDWWKDAVGQVFTGSREQYFIRISSNKPFREIWAESGIREIMEAVGELGVIPSDLSGF